MATSSDSLELSQNARASAVVGDECDSTSDELIKFLMSRNISLDVINDSHFQRLLKSAAQNGKKSCLFMENSSVIERSLWKFEDEIKQNMRMIIESWKITGCSLMHYTMKVDQQDKSVVGFYCPKGFIFLEVGPSKEEIESALNELVPDSLKYAVQFILHNTYYHSQCKYQALYLVNGKTYFESGNERPCIWQRIYSLWEMICKKSSWVQSIIKKSDLVFESISRGSMSNRLFDSFKEKEVEDVASSSFARLSMIVKLNPELRFWVSRLGPHSRFNLQYDTDVITTINSTDFWTDAENLVQVLTPLFEISSLLETLVPSSGYLLSAIDKASVLLKTYTENEPLKYEPIFESLTSWQLDFHVVQDLTSHLNPGFFFNQDFPYDFTLWDNRGLIGDEEDEILSAEIDSYCTKTNPFADVSVSELKANHPITLWSKYGDGFPLLRKLAYKFLSQPASCLCHQVHKHMLKIEGSDNCILRLNVMMMEEFTMLGEQIYQPINF